MLLLLFQRMCFASAFLAPAPGQRVKPYSSTSSYTPQFQLRISQVQQTSKIGLWGKTDEEDPEKLQSELPATEDQEELSIVSKVLQSVFTVVTGVFGLFFYAAGGYFSVGLLLNLCGYGYYINRDGFQVDTLEHMRAQNQFEREYQRLGRESESRPPSLLPK